LRKGLSGADKITRFDYSPYNCHIACELKGYDAADFFDRKQARKLDPFAQYAVVAADQAIADAGLVDNDKIDRSRFGVIWSSGIGRNQRWREVQSFLHSKDDHRHSGWTYLHET